MLIKCFKMKTKLIKTDLAIIGGGVAGLSAAMYARRLELKVHIFGLEVGGTIALAHIVENYPGFKSLTGMELSNKIKEHAQSFKPKFVYENVLKISKKGKCFIVETKNKKYHARAVILSTGTKWKKLDVPGEKEFEKKGVHYCALCDGPFYKNKVVAVVGGGDGAVKEALFLSKITKKVYIIYRSKELRPEPINLERAKKARNIKFIKNTEVLEILGKEKFEKIRLSKKYNNSYELAIDAVFVDIGRIPQTGLAKPLGVKMNKKGEIVTDKLMKTNIPGFFAAGDVTDTPFKQAITAASEGSTAAYSAYQHITKNPLCTYNDEPI